MVDAIKILVDQLDLPDDVIGIIHEHLQGYYQYRRCARELLMPHFHRSLASINKQIPKWYNRTDVHPGRDLVRIIRPRIGGFSSGEMSPFKGERVNIHGLSKSRYAYNTEHACVLECTHDDLDTVLTMLGCKRFKSKKKKEKITLLLKAA